MQKLFVYENPTAQWHSLVNEAQAKTQVFLETELESYLVFLLMRFTDDTTVVNSIMALDFFNGLNNSGSQRHQALRDVADKCLLFSGLFPGRAEARCVDLNYFVNIGRSCYYNLSTDANPNALTFQKLSAEFIPMIDILHAARLDETDQLQQHLQQLAQLDPEYTKAKLANICYQQNEANH